MDETELSGQGMRSDVQLDSRIDSRSAYAKQNIANDASKNRPNLTWICVSIFLLFALSIVWIGPAFTGMIAYVDYEELLLHINESHTSDYELPIEIGAYNIVNITSVKISGYILGNASIYITDGTRTYLVADSRSKNEISLITGLDILDLSLDESNDELTNPKDGSIPVVPDEIDHANSFGENISGSGDEGTNESLNAPLDGYDGSEYVNVSIVNMSFTNETGTIEDITGQGYDETSANATIISDDDVFEIIEENITTNVTANDNENNAGNNITTINAIVNVSIYDNESMAISPIEINENNENISFNKTQHTEQLNYSALSLFELDEECIDTCNVLFGPDLSLIISPEEGSSVYISDVHIIYIDDSLERQAQDQSFKELMQNKNTSNYTSTVPAFTLNSTGMMNAKRPPSVDVFRGLLTTDFSKFPDMTSVPRVVLQDSTYGLINWSSGGYNVESANFSKFVKIGQGFAYVNSSGLNSTLNSSATIILNNLSYLSPIIYRDGVLCSSCSVLSYYGKNLTFTVAGFSNYTVGSNTNISIWDTTDTESRYVDESTFFYANYTNMTSGSSINGTGAYCEFKENSSGAWSSPINMTFNSTSKLYEYSKIIANPKNSTFNVSCFNNKGFDNLTLTDGFEILQSSCSVISTANTRYTMHNDLTSTTTCFSITADNVTLDCNGYKINYSTLGNSGYAVSVEYFDNITIRNCNIVDGDMSGYSGRDAIYLYDSLNPSIYNNNVSVGSSSALLLTTANGIVYNNTLVSDSGNAVYLYGSNNNTLENNTEASSSGYGIAVAAISQNNTFMNNNATSSSGAGLYIESSKDNSFILQRAYSTTAAAKSIYLVNSSNILITDCKNISGAGPSIEISSAGTSLNNTLVNCSYSGSENVASGKELIRKWYFDVTVANSTGSPINGSFVNVYNYTYGAIYNATTDINGDITRTELVEYVDFGGTKIFSTPHILDVSKSGYSTNTSSVNISSSKNTYVNVVLIDDPSQVTDCGTLSISNTYYALLNNVSSSGTCMIIGADNITLDCEGKKITYSSAGGSATYGILENNRFNSTIMNCVVFDGNWSSANNNRYGIYLSGSDYSTLSNNYVNTSNSAAIYSSGAAYNILINNTGLTNRSQGMRLDASSNYNVLINNTARNINTNEGTGITGYSRFNNVTGQNTQGDYRGVIFINSNDNIFDLANSTGNEAFRFVNSSNNIIMGSIVIKGSTSDFSSDPATNSINNTLINCSYNISKESITAGSEIIRKWYFDANVTNSTGSPLAAVNISIFSYSGASLYSELTDADGSMTHITLTEYANNGGTRTYYTPHIVNASKSEYLVNSSTYNLSTLNNVFTTIVLNLVPYNAPIITSISPISPVDPLEASQKLITFNFTANDLNGNSTINVSSAKIVVNNSGVQRQSTPCSGFAMNATAQNISCNVSLQYYDPAGIWNVNVSVKDNDENYTQNTTTAFTYNVLCAISLNTANLDIGSLDAGANDVAAPELILNNTGNFNYTLVQLKAFNLMNGTDVIGAGNFTINLTNSSAGTKLLNDTYVNVTSAKLSRATDSGLGNQSMYIYVDVPLGIAAKAYRSISEWMLLFG